MAVGRNDPCPCGSGKKYKKCCWGKDQDKPQALVPTPPSPPRFPRPAPLPPKAPTPPWLTARPPVPPPTLTPQEQKWDDFFDRYEKTPGAEREAMIREALDDPAGFPAGVAFDAFSLLHDDLAEAGGLARFAELVARLRQESPAAYARDAAYYATTTLDDAVLDGRLDDARDLARAAGEAAGQDIDLVTRSLDLLAYHGLTALALEVFRAGWPHVRAAGDDVFPHAIAGFAASGGRYEIYRALENNPATTADDPALTERLSFFNPDGRADLLAVELDALAGRSPTAWTLADFPLTSRVGKKALEEQQAEGAEAGPDGRANLTRLIVQFVGHCWREGGLSLPRAGLAALALQEYLVRRPRGDYYPGAAGAWKKGSRPPAPLSPLAPERGTLDQALTGLVAGYPDFPHHAAALWEIQPAWLRFLEARGLIDAAAHHQVLADLRQLQPKVVNTWKSFKNDPALLAAAEAWPDVPPRPATAR